MVILAAPWWRVKVINPTILFVSTIAEVTGIFDEPSTGEAKLLRAFAAMAKLDNDAW